MYMCCPAELTAHDQSGCIFKHPWVSLRLRPLCSDAQVPDAKVFDDFGGRAMGRAGRRLVYATIYTAILLNPILLHLTSAEALEHSLPEARFHRTSAPILVACLMAPLAQVTGLLILSTRQGTLPDMC